MKYYFCVIKQFHWRTAEPIGKTCCAVCAENEDEARMKVDKLCGDHSVFEFAQEIDPAEGYSYTVYKSQL